MRIPVSWLRDYVEFSQPTDELAERLTLAGIEVAALKGIGIFDRRVIVAAIRENQPIEGDPSVRLLTLDTGGGRLFYAVSTAPDLAEAKAGTRVAAALPGATVFRSGHDVELVEIDTATVRGVRSEGVVLSEQELGIGNDHSQVLQLGSRAEPGRPVLSYLQAQLSWDADELIELEILANIARCQSIRGLAREVAAVTGGLFRSDIMVASLSITKQTLDLGSFDPEVCRRFSVLLLDNVTIRPSPRWIQVRLQLAGISPINNVVDVANYVMMELGQPMHTYDAERLPDLRLGVRRAGKGERLHTLLQTGEAGPMELVEGVPLVTSNGRPVAVAGVVGGTETAVSDDTRRVLIESANFDFITIRRAQSALKVYTEASARFSRGVDPGLTTMAIGRFVHLLSETLVGELKIGVGRDFSLGIEDISSTVNLDVSEANASLGTHLSLNEMHNLLGRAGIANFAEPATGRITATIMSERQDISIPADLMEEIVRLYGYDKLPETMPIEPIPTHPRNNHRHTRERARDAIVIAGLQEVITYSLTTPELERRLYAGSVEPPPSVTDYVRVLNPISSERVVMRRSLLPEVLVCVQRNLRHQDSCHVFELGQVFLPTAPSDANLLPNEEYRLAIAMCGPIDPASMHRAEVHAADYLDLAEVVQNLFEHLHIKGVQFRPAQSTPFHSGISAAVFRGDKVYGHIGELHPHVAQTFGLEGRGVVCADLYLDSIISDGERFFALSDIPRQPSIISDISVAVAEDMLSGTLREIVRNSAGPFLRGVEVFDVYRGPGVREGQKAVGLRLTLNAESRTLTTAEEREVFDRVVENLRLHAGAELRG